MKVTVGAILGVSSGERTRNSHQQITVELGERPGTAGHSG